MEEFTVHLAAPWQLLAAAAPSIIKGVGHIFGVGKPSKSDYTPDTSYMDKYIANIRGRQSNKEVYHQAMQPALRTIGQQGRRMQKQVGYDVAKSGLGGSGIEAQQRLSAGKATLGAMQEASEKATAAQLTESRRLGTEADRMTMQKEGAIAQGEQAYGRAKSAYRDEVVGNIIGGVGAVAGAGLQKYAAGTEAFESAKAAGLTDAAGKEFTRDTFMSAAKAADFSDPSKYAESLTKQKGISESIGFLKKDIVSGFRKLGISDEKIASLGSANLERYASIFTDPNVSEQKKKELMDTLEKILKG